MKRTKQPGENQQAPPVQNMSNDQLHALGELFHRTRLAQQLGMQYGGNRDVYTALGYSKDLHNYQYWQAYTRQDIAKRINDAPVDTTWRDNITVTDSSESGQFDEAWNNLVDRLRLYNKFNRVDKLAGLGYYAILVLGFDDVQDEQQFKEPVSESGNRKLLYVHPYSDRNVEIDQWEDDPTNDRYGLPRTYRVKIGIPGRLSTSEGSAGRELTIHHTRIIHVAEGLLESEVYGTPRLQAVYNRLEDLMKIVGGSAEMFWRGAMPGYAAKKRDNATMGQQDKEELDDQFQEYEHNLRRWLRVSGIDIDQLSPQVVDPASHVDVQLTMISAASSIPKRILSGSERGELSSSMDETHWNNNIDDRRNNYAEPIIMRAVIDRIVFYGVLPAPENDNYDVQWPDLWSPGMKEKSEIANGYATALKSYSSAPAASTVLPEYYFLRDIMQLPEETVEEIMQDSGSELAEEEREAEADRQAIEEDTGMEEGQE